MFLENLTNDQNKVMYRHPMGVWTEGRKAQKLLNSEICIYHKLSVQFILNGMLSFFVYFS